MRLTTAASRLLAIFGLSAICATAVPALEAEKLPYDLARLRLAGVISGEDGRSKIIGGKVVEPANKYPFQVALLVPGFAGREREAQFCGGSLIADNWVLTASHCVLWEDQVTGEVSHLGPHQIEVYSGSANFRKGDRIKVKKVISHRTFKHATMSSDIALLQLARAPKRGWKYKIIDYKAVAIDPALSAEGKQTTVIGWGRTDDGSSPISLREVDVPISTNEVCERASRNFKVNLAKKQLAEMAETTGMDDTTYQRHLQEIETMTGGVDDTMLCAGRAEGGKDACQGDSGGPLFLKTADGKFAQVGVVSWGWGCGLPEVRGLYTRVSKFTDWIEQNTGASN